jgi:hypothetical protein
MCPSSFSTNWQPPAKYHPLTLSLFLDFRKCFYLQKFILIDSIPKKERNLYQNFSKDMSYQIWYSFESYLDIIASIMMHALSEPCLA